MLKHNPGLFKKGERKEFAFKKKKNILLLRKSFRNKTQDGGGAQKKPLDAIKIIKNLVSSDFDVDWRVE